MTHYGDPTESLLIEPKEEIRELRNRISSLESELDRLSGFQVYIDPVELSISFTDLNDDIGNLSDEVVRVQAQLKRLETKVDETI